MHYDSALIVHHARGASASSDAQPEHVQHDSCTLKVTVTLPSPLFLLVDSVRVAPVCAVRLPDAAVFACVTVTVTVIVTVVVVVVVPTTVSTSIVSSSTAITVVVLFIIALIATEVSTSVHLYGAAIVRP
jgi:hypothetical protein